MVWPKYDQIYIYCLCFYIVLYKILTVFLFLLYCAFIALLLVIAQQYYWDNCPKINYKICKALIPKPWYQCIDTVLYARRRSIQYLMREKKESFNYTVVPYYCIAKHIVLKSIYFKETFRVLFASSNINQYVDNNKEWKKFAIGKFIISWPILRNWGPWRKNNI